MSEINRTPEWVRNAVIYGTLPNKFGAPPLRATTARLGYLEQLGITAIWLAPSNTTIPYEAGYAVIDYFGVRADFGTADDLRELVTEAHRRGIRVLMDFVPNHTSDRHPYYLDAEAHGARSEHYDFYDRDADGQATYYFSWKHLPNLNFDNPEVRRFMTEAMSYWVREFDIDGYRVDVAWGVKQRAPDFWPDLRRELQRIKPDVFLLAEASGRDPYYVENGFDAAYDWTDRLGEWAWQDVWEPADGLVQRLRAALTNDGLGYPAGSRILRFINNNDTGERFVDRYGPGRTRVAAAMQFTLPGIPCPYTGDEIGASFHPYADIGPLDWDRDPHDLRAYYRRLIALRKELAGLRGPEFTEVAVEPGEWIYAYVRPADTSPVLVVLNYHDRAYDARLRLPEPFGSDVLLRDRLHEESFRAGAGHLEVNLPAHTARVLAHP